jgi:hypothetical protein
MNSPLPRECLNTGVPKMHHALEVKPTDQQAQTGRRWLAVLSVTLTKRLVFYWLLFAALLAILDVILSVALVAVSATAADRTGIRFNLFISALAIALSVACGYATPTWWRRAIILLATAPIPVLLITSRNTATGVAVLLLAFIASWLGRQLTALLLGKLDPVDSWVIGATFGLGLIASGGLILGTLHALRPAVTWTLIIIVALALVVKGRGHLAREASMLGVWLSHPSERKPLPFLLAGAMLACYWLNLSGALAPEVRPDAIRQRLVAATHFAQNGHLRPTDPDVSVAAAPALGEIAYSAALTLGTVQGAQLLHFLAGLCCAGAIFALGRRLGGPLAGGLGAVAFYCTLMTSYLSQTAYLDFFTTLFSVTAALLLVLRKRTDWRIALAAGMCLGFGVAVKVHVGYVAVGLAGTAGFLALRYGGLRRACQVCATLAGAAVVAAAPWMVRSYAYTSKIPGLEYATSALTTTTNGPSAVLFDLKIFGYGQSLRDLLALPFTAILTSNRFGGGQLDTSVIGGHIGFLLLGMCPLLFVVRKHWRVVAILSGALVATLLWFHTAQYLRYGLPIIAILSAAGGAAFATALRQSSKPAALNFLLGTLAISGVLIRIQMPDLGHRYTLGLQSREAFLVEYLGQEGAGSYAILRLLDDDPSVARVFAMHDGARLYTRARISSPFTTSGDLALEGNDELVLQRLREGGYSHIMLDRRIWAGPTLNWDRMSITNEDFLRRHTVLVAGGDYCYLYRIIFPGEGTQGESWTEGGELLTNGDLEAGNTAWPRGWVIAGQPQNHHSHESSPARQGMVLLMREEMLTTTVPVQAGTSYLIATTGRGEGGYGFLQTRIEWRDSAGQTLGISGEDTPVTPRAYQTFSTLVTAPAGAATAIISLQPTAAPTWVDTVSLHTVAGDTSVATRSIPPTVLR